MNATAWSLIAAVLAVGIEYSFRTLPPPWHNPIHFAAWMVVQMSLGFCIYKLINAPGTTFLAAFVIWAFATLCMRVALNLFVLHDPISKGTWAALSLLLLARIVQHFWR